MLFFVVVAGSDHGMEFLPMTTRLLYQMGQQDLNRSLMPDIDAMMGDTMPSLLVDVIKTLARRNQEVSEENKKDIDEVNQKANSYLFFPKDQIFHISACSNFMTLHSYLRRLIHSECRS